MKKTTRTNPDETTVTFWLGKRVRIGAFASIGDGARIGDSASIGAFARIVSENQYSYPVCLSPLENFDWSITVTPNHIVIGCQSHPVVFWQNVSPEQLQQMHHRAQEFWTRYGSMILIIAASAPTDKVDK